MPKSSKKKYLIIAAVVLAIIAIVAGVLIVKNNKTKAEPETETREKRRITVPVNIIPVAERPYVQIVPKADGRHLTIQVLHLNKKATEADYELEYQSGSMLQGAMGLIMLGELPAEEEIFLGSCSAGGACTYHEDISGGNLLLQFDEGDDTYAVKSDWRYFDNTQEKSETVASKDAKFKLTSEALANQKYLVVYNTPGPAKNLNQDLLSDIYAVSSSGSLKTVSQLADLSIRMNQEAETATIVGYDGQEWQEFETTIDGKEATAQVQLMELYAVVAP